MLMKEAVVRAVANLLCAIIIAISIFIGFGMLWEQDQLDREQREKHHREQKTLMSALIAVISDQSSESHSVFQESVSSPEIITTPGTIQNAPKIPASLLSERTARPPTFADEKRDHENAFGKHATQQASKSNASQEQ